MTAKKATKKKSVTKGTSAKQKGKGTSKKVVLTPAQKGAATRRANQQARSIAAAEKQLKRIARNRARKQERSRAAATKAAIKLTKDIEAVTKQSKRGAKNLGKNVAAGKKLVSKLKEIVTGKKAAPKKSTKKRAPKKEPVKVKKLSQAKLREVLDPNTYFDYESFMYYLEENAVEINASLKKGERFAATYMGGRTKKTYPSIQALIGKLNTYEASKRYANDEGERGQELIHSIKIQAVVSDRTWVTENKRQKKMREKEADIEFGAYRKAVGGTRKGGGKKNRQELMKEYRALKEKEAAELRAEIERLKKKGKK